MGRRTNDQLIESLLLHLEAIAVVRPQVLQKWDEVEGNVSATEFHELHMRLIALYGSLGSETAEIVEALRLLRTRANNTTRISIGVEQRKLKRKVG